MRFSIIGALAFATYWIVAHLLYAFIMLEWSPFTEWEPISRAFNLLGSVGLANATAMTFQHLKSSNLGDN
jgi:hypothetical protein